MPLSRWRRLLHRSRELTIAFGPRQQQRMTAAGGISCFLSPFALSATVSATIALSILCHRLTADKCMYSCLRQVKQRRENTSAAFDWDVQRNDESIACSQSWTTVLDRRCNDHLAQSWNVQTDELRLSLVYHWSAYYIWFWCLLLTKRNRFISMKTISESSSEACE